MGLRITTRSSLELLIQFVYDGASKDPAVHVTNLDTAITEVLEGDTWPVTAALWAGVDSVHIIVSTVRAPRDMVLVLDVGHTVRSVRGTRMTFELKAPPDEGATFTVTAGREDPRSVRVQMQAATASRSRMSLTIGPTPGDDPGAIPIIFGGPSVPTGGGPKGWEPALKALLPEGVGAGVVHLVETLRDERLVRSLEQLDDSTLPQSARHALRMVRELAERLDRAAIR